MTLTLSPRACAKCRTFKSWKEFYKDSAQKCGYGSQCKQCHSVSNKQWRSKNTEQVKKNARRTKLKLLYGISPEIYSEMLKAQNNACAICGINVLLARNKKLCVDHCHNSKKIRQLLCSKCNSAIGLLNEDPLLFDAAKKYLERHDPGRDQVA